MDNREIQSIQHQRLEALPAHTQEWLRNRVPEIPRAQTLPWLFIFLFGVVGIALIIELMQNGLRGLSRRDKWGPLLFVGLLFGLPMSVGIVRDWRRNQLGKWGGYPLGFHFSAEGTYWRDTLDDVWTIPRGCVSRIHLSLSSYYRWFGIYPGKLQIIDIHDNDLTVEFDFDLPTLWRAMRDHYPEAEATYDFDLGKVIKKQELTAKDPPKNDATTVFTVLNQAPHVPLPPQAPTLSSDETQWNWAAINDYFRTLMDGQGIEIKWGEEQRTGETRVYISRPVLVQWQTLFPLAPAIDDCVGTALKEAMAQDRGKEWVSLWFISLATWVNIYVDEAKFTSSSKPQSPPPQSARQP
jgi:hypothetical protein